MALHLERDGQAVQPVEGREFAVLPVGRRTGLPVHTSAVFELPADSKLYHTEPTRDVQQRMQARWNTALYTNIVDAYVAVLVWASTSHCAANPLRLYKWWPQEVAAAGDPPPPPARQRARELVVVPLMQKLAELPMFLSKHGGYERLASGFIPTAHIEARPSPSCFRTRIATHVILIELRLALIISYQDYHMLLLTLAGRGAALRE